MQSPTAADPLAQAVGQAWGLGEDLIDDPGRDLGCEAGGLGYTHLAATAFDLLGGAELEAVFPPEDRVHDPSAVRGLS